MRQCLSCSTTASSVLCCRNLKHDPNCTVNVERKDFIGHIQKRWVEGAQEMTRQLVEQGD